MTTFDELDQKLLDLIHVSDKIEQKVAPEITNIMRNTAVAMIDYHQAVDTGALRNSVQGAADIIIREDEATVSMGIVTRMEYAKFIEFGTGANGSAEYESVTGESYTSDVSFQTEKQRWYQHNPEYAGEPGRNNDPNGRIEFIPRYAQHPRPFMRPALYDNVPVFEDRLKAVLTEDLA